VSLAVDNCLRHVKTLSTCDAHQHKQAQKKNFQQDFQHESGDRADVSSSWELWNMVVDGLRLLQLLACHLLSTRSEPGAEVSTSRHEQTECQCWVKVRWYTGVTVCLRSLYLLHLCGQGQCTDDCGRLACPNVPDPNPPGAKRHPGVCVIKLAAASTRIHGLVHMQLLQLTCQINQVQQ
jgi:hypothetical protein